MLQLPGLRLTFYDWASVVPNLAPNFSIAKMAAAALAGEPVRYSAGDFGRPLLGAADAGRALLLATEARLEVAAGASAVAGQGGCEVRDAPGRRRPTVADTVCVVCRSMYNDQFEFQIA